MSIAINGLDSQQWGTRDMDASGNNKITTYHLLAFTGSYVTGGDTLDLTLVQAQVPTGYLPDIISWEGNGASASFTGQGGYFQIAKGATISTNKMKAFAAGGSEESASTYASLNISTDVITLVCTWKKLISQP